jgi:thiol:disulfide interchange protein DsbD
MHVLKVSLGYLELAAAIKFFSNVDLRLGWNVLPRELFLLIWAGIFVMGSLYILNVYRLDGDSKASIGPRRMLAGLCTLLVGLYFFWGSLGYQLDWISSALAPPYSAQRVAGVGGGAAKNPQVTWTIVKDDIEGALARAKEEGKPVLVNFTGHL